MPNMSDLPIPVVGSVYRIMNNVDMCDIEILAITENKFKLSVHNLERNIKKIISLDKKDFSELDVITLIRNGLTGENRRNSGKTSNNTTNTTDTRGARIVISQPKNNMTNKKTSLAKLKEEQIQLPKKKDTNNFLKRMKNNINRRKKKRENNVRSNVSNTGLAHRVWGGNKEYINLQSGGKRLVRYGVRGGKYYMKGGQKVYLK
jgi:hypothetical protein